MIRKALRHVAAVSLLLAPGILRAGANTWTGGRPVETVEARSLVAAHPADPDVVYAAFGAELYRSGDGGRTWNRLQSFSEIRALLVHPASPSTIYVAADDVFKSIDDGATWSATSIGSVDSLAGSPTDASTVFAGGWNRISKTTDAGTTWSAASYEGAIASLVVNPRDPTIAYAGAEGINYWGWYAGSIGKTTDGGASWQKPSPEAPDSVVAIAVDSVASSTVYLATGDLPPIDGSYVAPSALRSEDGGVSWTSASEGLPFGRARSLAVDPRVSGMLYSGTEAGVYRSRDGGRSWTSFSQRLTGVPITSLAISSEGRRILAGTTNGVYEMEIARGPVDVAAGPADGSRVLVWDRDRLAVGTLDASGDWTSAAAGDPSATWTAIAIATAEGARTHVLWQNGDGRTSLEIRGPAGRQSATVFRRRQGWIASDLAVRSDGQTDVLWSGPDGRMSIARVNSAGVPTDGPEYGPATSWSAIALSNTPGGDTWVLWRSTDGRAALSVHRDLRMMFSYKYAAHPDGAVEDVAVGADGRPRLLRISPGGLASVATVDAAGRLTAEREFSLPGFTPRRIAAGEDGRTRLLFGNGNGQGELVLLNADNTESARHPIPAEP